MEKLPMNIFRTLTWTTTFPVGDVTKSSGHFTFQNSDWYLFFQENALSDSKKEYVLYLVSTDVFQPFQVTCFARDSKEGRGFAMQVKKYPSDLPVGKIWTLSESSIVEEVGNLKGKISFMIIFESEENSALELRTKSDDTEMSLDPDLSSLSSDLGKLLASEDAADVQLQSKDATRPAHKSILAARSEVFSAMFRSKMKESIDGVIDVGFMDAEVLDKFLEYMYTGKLSDFPSRMLLDIYTLGDKYAVHSLKRLCCDWVVKNLSNDNYQSFLEIADCHSDEPFKDAIIKVINANPEWLNCEMWFQFSKEHPALANEVYRKFYDKTYFKKTDCDTEVNACNERVECESKRNILPQNEDYVLHENNQKETVFTRSIFGRR